jgi:PAS domain-containing protein
MIDPKVIDEASYTEVVGDVYDCVLEPSRWQGTLARIASLTQSASSSVIINDAFDAKGGRIFEYGADQKYLRLYYERYATADLRPPAEQVRGLGEVATLEMLCRGELPLAPDFFNDFIKPQGFGDLIAIQLLRSGRRMGWLSTARSGIQLRYHERERQLMKLLSPHLCQALTLSDAIDLTTLSSNRLEQTVDALSTGVFLTDQEGRIAYVNKTADT